MRLAKAKNLWLGFVLLFTGVLTQSQTLAVPLATTTDGFDYPIGKPDASGWKILQGFNVWNQYYYDNYGKGWHSGEDWQSNSGGAATVGQPVYAAAIGHIKYAQLVAGNPPGYPGGVVIIEHTLPDNSLIYSMYGHLSGINVSENTWVGRGQQVGTILTWPGDVSNSHLHFEIRNFYVKPGINDNPYYPPGPGYWSADPQIQGWLRPSTFIDNNRPSGGTALPKQASDLTVSPSSPQINQTVTFSFDVRNYGGQAIIFQNIGPQGHGPPGGQGGLWNIFAHDVTVGTGQTVNVSARRSFEWEGTWCVEHIPMQDQNGNWSDLSANGYRQAQCFQVGSVTPPPGGATLYEHETFGGLSETFTADDGNLGDNAIGHDRATSVRVRGPYFTTLYEHPDYAGTAESFHHDDPNLGDNHIGNDTVSSLRVYPAVSLCEHTNLGGKCETFISDVPNLEGTYIGQDTVSSVKVPGSYVLTLYEHPNYEGREEVFTGEDSNLSDNHIGNDTVSSIKVERIVLDGVTLFEHQNFVGRNRTFTGDVSNLPGEYADMASSIKIRGPFMARVYEHPNYAGTGETFSHDDLDLRDNHISSDAISSVRVWPAAALYEHVNYQGRGQTFDRDDANLSGTYIDSDTASSLKVPIGYLVALCEHPNFDGACQTFTANNSNLSNTNVGNDTVSSITVAAVGDYDAENGGTPTDFWVDPGESFDVTISVRNNGDAIWRRIHQVRLGLLTWNDTMGVFDLRRDLDPGESV